MYVFTIGILNLFFNQYSYYDKLRKSFIVKFIIIFLNRFNLNFEKKFGHRFNKIFISNFNKRFNKFFIKVFSEAFNKKKSNYLYLERYIEKTIGILALIDKNLLNLLINKLVIIQLICLLINLISNLVSILR